jgi:hypothetical protein
VPKACSKPANINENPDYEEIDIRVFINENPDIYFFIFIHILWMNMKK